MSDVFQNSQPILRKSSLKLPGNVFLITVLYHCANQSTFSISDIIEPRYLKVVLFSFRFHFLKYKQAPKQSQRVIDALAQFFRAYIVSIVNDCNFTRTFLCSTEQILSKFHF